MLGDYAVGSRKVTISADNAMVKSLYTGEGSGHTALFAGYEQVAGVYVPVITSEDVALPVLQVGWQKNSGKIITVADNGATVYVERNTNGVVTGAYYIMPDSFASTRLFGGAGSLAERNGRHWCSRGECE